MIIACPKCETSFSLPDELYKPGKKARCSNCGFVFPMPPLAAAQKAEEPELGYGEVAPAPEIQKSSPVLRYRKVIIAALAGVFIVLLAYGGWMIVSSFFSGDKGAPSDIAGDGTVSSPDSGTAPDGSKVDATEERERLINSISFDEITQYLVDNVVIGKIMVIQGVAVNISDTPKEYIRIETRVLDANGRSLAQVQQYCGVSLELFQLQSMTKEQLTDALNNRFNIVSNNTHVPPGGKVPFVVVLPLPPEAMRTFEVRVIDVQESS